MFMALWTSANVFPLAAKAKLEADTDEDSVQKSRHRKKDSRFLKERGRDRCGCIEILIGDSLWMSSAELAL